MLVVTTDAVPGYAIRQVLGEVVGVTVRTRNVFVEGIRRPDGDWNPYLPGLLIRWRRLAVERMAQEAQHRGGNAVVGMRFDHREISEMWVEICSYGTAVRIDRLA